MDRFSLLIAEYGAAAMFLVAFVENIGVPFPALPAFILGGALVAGGRGSFPALVAGAVAGALLADFGWYLMGRWRGRQILDLLCRVTFNPDACVERAEGGFHRHRVLTILFAKFLPGLNTVVPPMAGVISLPAGRFLLLDAAGSVVWAAAGVGAGMLFGNEVTRHAARFNGTVVWAALLALFGYFVWRLGYRYYLLRYFTVPRIEPEDLHGRLAGGEPILLMDLRAEHAWEASRETIPGSRRFRPATFRKEIRGLTEDQDIVLFCT